MTTRDNVSRFPTPSFNKRLHSPKDRPFIMNMLLDIGLSYEDAEEAIKDLIELSKTDPAVADYLDTTVIVGD